MELNKIYAADCFNLMDDMVKENVNPTIILTSPPYFTEQRKNLTCKNAQWLARYKNFTQITNREEYIEWSINLFKSFEKVLCNDGVVIFNLSYGTNDPSIIYHIITEIEKHTTFKVYDTIYWKKSVAIPITTSSNGLTRIVEPVFIFAKHKKYTANKTKTKQSKTGQQYYAYSTNSINATNNDGINQLNKATFSTEFVLQLLEKYAPKDEKTLVYDPFMGIGTTKKACDMYGVQSIGSEIDKEQVDYYYNSLLEIEN
jgi:DNA modification methylase